METVEPSPPPATSRRRELLVAAGVLALLLVACYRDVVFDGRSLVFSNFLNPQQQQVTPAAYGPHAIPAATWERQNLQRAPNLHDPGSATWQWEPAAEYMRHALEAGEAPWWDPYLAAGAPGAGNLVGTYFFPPYLLVVLLGHGALVCTIYALLLLLAAALAGYLLLRRHGLSHLASLVGATALLFAGGLHQNLGSMLGQTLATLPVALLVTHWFLSRGSWRRAGVLALAYATMALSTFPPLVWVTFGVTALYALAWLLATRDVRLAARWATGVVLALAIAGFAYATAVAALRDAPQAQGVYAHAADEVMPWQSLGGLVSATVMGTRKVFVDPPMRGYAVAEVSYVGVAALLLAALAGAPRRREGALLLAVLLATAALMAMKLVGLEPVHTLAHAPLVGQVHFVHYLGPPLSLLLALLAAFGAERLLTGALSPRRAWLSIGAFGVLLLVMPAVAAARGALAHRFAADWLSRWYALLALLAAASMVIVMARRRPPSRRGALWIAAALVALIAVEGTLNTAYPRPRRWDAWSHPVPYLRAALAAQHGGRTFVLGPLEGDAGSAFGLYTLQSALAFNPGRTYDLYARYTGGVVTFFPLDAAALPPEGVLDAAAIDHLLLPRNHALLSVGEERGYRELYRDDVAVLLERPAPPRYFFSSQVRVVPPAQALAALAAPRPAREVLLERQPAWPPSPNQPGDPAVAATTRLDEVELQVHAPRAGIVYCSESQASGWSASVDGKPAPLIAANYAFRAVPVAAGEHRVVLRYRPPGLAAALLLALVGLAASTVLIVRREGAAVQVHAPALPDAHLSTRRVGIALVALLGVGIALHALGIGAPAHVALGDHAPPPPQADPFHVQWSAVQLPLDLSPGAVVPAIVTVTNTSRMRWPGGPADAGHPRVQLAYRWWRFHHKRGRVIADYGTPVELPLPLLPDRSTRVPFSLRLPPHPGNFVLQVDLVGAGRLWFADHGAARLLLPVHVRGGGDARDVSDAAPATTDSP